MVPVEYIITDDEEQVRAKNITKPKTLEVKKKILASKNILKSDLANKKGYNLRVRRKAPKDWYTI